MVCKVLWEEEGRADPIWWSSLSSREHLRFLVVEFCRDPELPERSGQDRRKRITLFVCFTHCPAEASSHPSFC